MKPTSFEHRSGPTPWYGCSPTPCSPCSTFCFQYHSFLSKYYAIYLVPIHYWFTGSFMLPHSNMKLQVGRDVCLHYSLINPKHLEQHFAHRESIKQIHIKWKNVNISHTTSSIYTSFQLQDIVFPVRDKSYSLKFSRSKGPEGLSDYPNFWMDSLHPLSPHFRTFILGVCTSCLNPPCLFPERKFFCA